MANAEKAYRDYLTTRGDLDTLGKVIAAIEDYAPDAEGDAPVSA